jgi:hypothetical protein
VRRFVPPASGTSDTRGSLRRIEHAEQDDQVSVGRPKAFLRRAHRNLSAQLAVLIPVVGTARRAPLPALQIVFLESIV